MTQPPFLDEEPAEFVDEEGATYALIGTVLDRTKVPENSPIHILVAPGGIREYGEKFLPLFEFFRTPRSEQQTKQWMEWAGGDDDILQTLLDTQAVVRVNTKDPISASKSLKGIRIVPQCLPDGTGSPEKGLVSIRTDTDSTVSLKINIELAEAIWGSKEPSDIHTEIKRTARYFKLPRKVAAMRVLTDIPMLLWHGYARLELVDGPAN